MVSIRRYQGPCRYVVTPNVDHLRLLQDNTDLRRAYADASLVLADGMPLVWASRMLGCPLPERVTGADLVPALFDTSRESGPLRVYLWGAGPGVGERAAARIEQRWPAVQVVGTLSPRVGPACDRQRDEAILRCIAAAAPDLVVVGLGAPKQEVWVHRHRERIEARVAVCVGATIDFLAGEKRRAWPWVGRCGLEWAYRLVCEPRRLLKRYAQDAWIFPPLVWREWQGRIT
jgi:N-acetylglucosaminyldiphosphoundecaprenol N-acetyl-beta-D-mannosaminyltransferase